MTHLTPARNLLIVDDDRDALYSFQRILQRGLLNVQVADSGEDALDQAQRSLPDCVLMDLRMPGMDGLETLRRFRQVLPRTPIILMSAYAGETARTDAVAAGAMEFLRKPVSVPQLRKAVLDGLAAGELNRRYRDSWPESLSELLPGNSAAAQSIRAALGPVLAQGVLTQFRVQGPIPLIRIQGHPHTGRRHLGLGIHRILHRSTLPPHVVIWPQDIKPDSSDDLELIQKLQLPLPTLVVVIDEYPLSDSSAEALQNGLRTRSNRPQAPGPGCVLLIEPKPQGDRIALREWVSGELVVHLPDLAERAEDIPEISQQVASDLVREMNQPHQGPVLTDWIARRLGSMRWPGQISQLRTTLRDLLTHTDSLPLASAPGFEPTEDFGNETGDLNPISPLGPGDDQSGPIPIAVLDRLFEELRRCQPLPAGLDMFDLVERYLIQQSLSHFNGNQSRAARFLGITRNTLRKRVAKYGFGQLQNHSSSSADSSS